MREGKNEREVEDQSRENKLKEKKGVHNTTLAASETPLKRGK